MKNQKKIPAGYLRALEYRRFLKNKIRHLLETKVPFRPFRTLLQGSDFLAEIAHNTILESGGTISAIWDNKMIKPPFGLKKSLYKDHQLEHLINYLDLIFITSITHETELRKKSERLFKKTTIISPNDIFSPLMDANQLMAERNCIVYSGLDEIKQNFPDHYYRYQLAAEMVDKNDQVLDIACGCGYGTYILAQKAKTCIGADLLPSIIEFANKHWNSKNITFQKADGNDIKKYFNNEAFSFICCLETLEHLPQPLKFLLELIQLIKPDGRLLLSTPQPPQGNPHHIHEFEFNDLLAFFQSTQMMIEKTFIQEANQTINQGTNPIPGQQYLFLLQKPKQ